MKNVKEIGDVLGVTLYFIKDIKRDLALILNKLDNQFYWLNWVRYQIFKRKITIINIRNQNVKCIAE